MSKGAKENWFQSPHMNRNRAWFFHDDKHSFQERLTFLTPSRQSKPIEVQRNQDKNYNISVSTQNDRFDDTNLADMFTNTIVESHAIRQKINFEESPIMSEEDDCNTPSKGEQCPDEANDNHSKELPKTAVKERHKYCEEQKKTRPKQKGLRMLSQKAYQIVTKLNGATYKEVANKLVDQLAAQDALEINNKDQQNIKRRVYDALNVLIALGILKKDGRKIYGMKKMQQNQTSEQQQQEQKERLTREIQEMQFRIRQKVGQHKNSKVRAQMIRALLRRNSQCYQKHHKIEFPFIALCLHDVDQNKVVVNRNLIQIHSSQRKIEPFGDMDTIQFLRPSLKLFMQ